MDDLDRLIGEMSPYDRRTVARRAGKRLAAIGLRALRQFARKTQADMKLSTLRDYVESLGGTLRIEAEIGGQTVDISAVARPVRAA